MSHQNTQKPPSLEETVSELLKQNGGKRTFSFLYEDQKYWVKQPEAGEANIWHKALLLASKVMQNNFFRPTVVTDPAASLAHEAQRLIQLAENGINVPKVMLHSKECLVLEDAGTPLIDLLGNPHIGVEEKRSVIIQVSQALADLHNHGFYHSRPALRDFTCKEGKVYFMDFEENLEHTLTLSEAIVRDGFLYVHTLYRKLRVPELVETALDAYRNALRPELWETLAGEAKRYRFTYALLKILRPYLGKDGVAIFDTLAYFRRF